MPASLHISLSAETIANFGGLEITNSIFTSLIVSFVLILLGLYIKKNLKNGTPSGFQNIIEMIIEGLYGMVKGVAGSDKKARSFFPLIASFFLFIILNNYFGLLPGVGTIGFEHEVVEEHAQTADFDVHASTIEDTAQANEEVSEDDHAIATDTQEESHEETEAPKTAFVPIFRPGTADLNTTLALGLISVIMTQIIGVRHLGLTYFKKFINFSNPLDFYVGILELISEFAKIVSFAFRLFGNIFAGEVLLVVIGSLVPLIGPMPFYGLEIFVGFIQALVFAMLSLVFFNMATQSHDDH